MRHFFLFVFLLLTATVVGQTITGVVKDTLNMPLESANVIAKPLQPSATLKFAITDNKGRYRLELEKEVRYEITVSYIGYEPSILLYEPESPLTTHDFILKDKGLDLKEVIITHKYEPLVIKKDTLVYDVKAFTSGNERKLREQLEKLPGVEVDKDGGVTVQGKRVTQFLVENKSFFGGGTKLGVENIPADAVDKVEVIDHFNEVDFLKQVSDSEDLAMNIRLKEDKKKFVFGDVEAAVGNDSFYLAHAALFYYTPKTNLSFIGDLNNVGKSTFNFEDLMRFQGGISSFISGRKSLSNLMSFSVDKRDVVASKSQFAALNFNHNINDKLALTAYGIVSKLFNSTKNETILDYVLTATNEQRTQQAQNQTTLGLFNVKLDYAPQKKERWFYNAHLEAANNDILSDLNTVSEGNAIFFENTQQVDNLSFKQFLEWHKSYNKAHTTTFVLNQSYERSKPMNHWFTNQVFLPGLIPLEDDDTYRVNQVKDVQGVVLDALFKHYWVINNSNHIYSYLGNNFENSDMFTQEQQWLSDGSVNDFFDAGFGNDTRYLLNDVFLGVEYKFRWGNWVNKPGLYGHFYHLNTRQMDASQSLSKFLWQPQWDSEYEFSQTESLKFKYELNNQFPQVNQMISRFTLQSYNAVFRGNALLSNERFHNATLRYNKMSMYRGLMFFAVGNFNKKEKTIRNVIQLDGINQFSTPVLTNNPETSARLSSTLSKKVYRFNVGVTTSLSWFEYLQDINGVEQINHRNSQNIGLNIRTAYKKWPSVRVGYNKGFSQFKGQANTDFQTDAFSGDFDYEILKNIVLKADYESFVNTNPEGNQNRFDIANASIAYQKKDKPFGFEFSVNNLFDINSKINNSFSDFLISEQTTFVLPRIFLLTVRYKL